jgi:general stress protein YciG
MENNTTQLTNNAQKTGKSRRGFASMDKERHKLVSSKGGKALRTTYTSRSQGTAVSSPLN